MRLEAAKVGQKNKHLADIQSAKKKILELQADIEKTNMEYEKWEAAWKELWEPTKIEPLSPAEMREWLEKYAQIKRMAQEVSQAKAAYKKLEGEIAQYKTELIAVLSEFAVVTTDQSLDELLNLAERHHKKVREDFFRRKGLLKEISEIQTKIQRLMIWFNSRIYF
jgi:ribosomal protein S17E